MTLQEFLQRLERVQRSGRQYKALCPAHRDQRASLSVGERDGRLLVKCFAGCTTEQVVSAMGLTMADLFVDGHPSETSTHPDFSILPDPAPTCSTSEDCTVWPQGEPGESLEPFAEYCHVPLTVLEGLPIASRPGGIAFLFGDGVEKFRRFPSPSKEFLWTGQGSSTPPLWPPPGETLPPLIWLTEGESDCIALRAAGAPAFAVTKGANTRLSPSQVRALQQRGVRTVRLVFDADEPGADGAQRLAEICSAAGLEALIADLGGWGIVDVMSGGKDLRDALLTRDPDELLRAMEEANWNSAHQQNWQRWTIFTLEDAFMPRPPLEFLAEGVICCPSLSIVYGAPGSMKTMLMMDLAVAISSGRPWLPTLSGEGALATKRSGVMWLDFDNGPRVMHERLEALAQGYQVTQGYEADLHYVSMPSPWLDASNESCVEELVTLVRQRDSKLLIVDNLRDVSGLVDENTAEMARVLSHFRRVAEYAETAVVLIHHQRKAPGERTGDTLRGHSSIEASLDLALQVKREGRSDIITVSPTKQRFHDMAPLAAEFRFASRPNSTELLHARFYGIPTQSSSADGALRSAILQVVSSMPDPTTEVLIRQVRSQDQTFPIPQIRNCLEVLIQEGAVLRLAGPHRSWIHRRNPTPGIVLDRPRGRG